MASSSDIAGVISSFIDADPGGVVAFYCCDDNQDTARLVCKIRTRAGIVQAQNCPQAAWFPIRSRDAMDAYTHLAIPSFVRTWVLLLTDGVVPATLPETDPRLMLVGPVVTDDWSFKRDSAAEIAWSLFSLSRNL